MPDEPRQIHAVPPLSREDLEALGEISGNFSVLEDLIQSFAWNLINRKDRTAAQIATALLSFQNLVFTLDRLFRHHSDDRAEHEELTALLRGALEAETDRNRILHSVWSHEHPGADSNTGVVVRVKHPPKKLGRAYSVVTEPMTADDLRAVAKRISALAARIQRFHAHYGWVVMPRRDREKSAASRTRGEPSGE